MNLPSEIFFLIINQLPLSGIRSLMSCCHQYNDFFKQMNWADYILPKIPEMFKEYYSQKIIDKQFMQLSGRYLVNTRSHNLQQWIKWWRQIPIPNINHLIQSANQYHQYYDDIYHRNVDDIYHRNVDNIYYQGGNCYRNVDHILTVAFETEYTCCCHSNCDAIFLRILSNKTIYVMYHRTYTEMHCLKTINIGSHVPIHNLFYKTIRDILLSHEGIESVRVYDHVNKKYIII